MRTITTHRSQGLRRRLAGAAVAVVSALSMTAAIAPRAQAATPSACLGKLCVFEHSNYGGRYVAYATGSSDMSRFGPYFNDRASSVRNGTGSRWCAYENANYGGRGMVIQPYQSISYLGWLNDRMSSIRRC